MNKMKFEDIEKYYKRIDIISEANLINFYATRLARTKNFDERRGLRGFGIFTAVAVIYTMV